MAKFHISHSTFYNTDKKSRRIQKRLPPIYSLQLVYSRTSTYSLLSCAITTETLYHIPRSVCVRQASSLGEERVFVWSLTLTYTTDAWGRFIKFICRRRIKTTAIAVYDEKNCRFVWNLATSRIISVPIYFPVVNRDFSEILVSFVWSE